MRYRGLDRNFISVLVFCFGHVEYRKGRRGDTEYYSISRVTSRTDSLASVKTLMRVPGRLGRFHLH